MEKHFIVCDVDGMRSYNEDCENVESFSDRLSAENRATELANLSPGKAAVVYEAVAHVKAGINLATVRSLK